ncbi:hypothetical protein [Aliamphritea spongicola]|uniref:hypothetical protein n=1 Tax=Aliamphritea spongicola TaxID=707589 RepID=UPI00196B9BF1|nr:hypothetical protein [Aliamphritea spongicola]MBN3562358.1 hypothetical protein [Aliamphritea spongicola]
MADTYKPMFNRTYLKVMLWIVAIAIVFLSASGRDTNNYLNIETIENKPIYFAEPDDTETLSVQLIFGLGPALNDEQKLLHKLLSQRLQQVLNSNTVNNLVAPAKASLQQSLQDDRITLLLSTEAEGTNQLSQLLPQLLQALNHSDMTTGTEAEWNRLKAELYLENQTAENRLLSAFTDTLSDKSSVHPLQRFPTWARNVFSNHNLTLAVSGPDAATAARLLAEELPSRGLTEQPLSTSASFQQRQTLPAIGNEAYALAGLSLPGRQSDSFMAQLIAVKSLQQTLTTLQPDVSTRLLWKSLDQQGYFALLLYGQRPPADISALTPLNRRLLNATDINVISATRENIKENFLERMSEQQAQLGLLNTLAFYRLPTDYISGFADRLADTSDEAVQEQLQTMLNINNQQFFYLPAR